jgi:S1-C subfamily serine protease
MYRLKLLPLLLVALACGAALHAQSKTEELLSAVVGVHAKIPAHARTAPFLGTERQGSGVIIDSDGLILTIGYLILEAEQIQVIGQDGTVVPAHFVGYDAETGFGVVRASRPFAGSPLKMGGSEQLAARNPVLIVSHGKPLQMRTAMVASRRTFAGYWEYLLEDAIFTTPPVQNFAGAALIDSDMRLAGIGSLFVADAAAEGESLPGNMFVPIDKLYAVLADLIATGRSSAPPKPWLGVYVTEFYGRVFVNRVAAGGPASEKGLKQGDILLTVQGRAIAGMEDFYRKLWNTGHAGTKVKLTVLQGTEISEIAILSSDRYKHYRSPTLQ